VCVYALLGCCKLPKAARLGRLCLASFAETVRSRLLEAVDSFRQEVVPIGRKRCDCLCQAVLQTYDVTLRVCCCPWQTRSMWHCLESHQVFSWTLLTLSVNRSSWESGPCGQQVNQNVM
jgi:hypothetical protein